MTNNAVWPSPDQQVAGQGRQDVHGTYLLDPATNKAVSPTGGGGGGGAITVADGADVTQGTSTDANTVASVMGRLTKIRDLLNTTLTVGGIITEANSAAILAKLVASPALEGGNLASILTQVTNHTETNSAAILAKLVGAPALEGGNLATLAGAITANKMQQVQILGSSVLSDTNPEPNISNIQQMILNGKAYSCSTGLVTAAANEACSFFVPNTNTTKNILIWSARLMYSNASQTTDMRLITADDTNITAGTSDAGNVTNLKVGGSASGSSFAMHHASAVTAPASSASTLPLDEILNPVNATVECLAPGMFIYVPPSTAGGVALYTGTTAAGKWQVVFRWVEY